jgi:hypothetical protein
MGFWRVTILAMVVIAAGWIIFTVYAAIEVDIPASQRQLRQETKREWDEAQRERQGAESRGVTSIW